MHIEQNNDSNVKTIMNKLLNRDPKIMSTYVFDGVLVYRKHDHLKLLLVPDAIKKKRFRTVSFTVPWWTYGS